MTDRHRRDVRAGTARTRIHRSTPPATARRTCATPTTTRCGSTRASSTAASSSGPLFGEGAVAAADADLTIGPDGEAVGQRIIVTGRLLDAGGRPIADSLVELWQANASGRYRHVSDQLAGHARPQLHRRRALPHRRRRHLPLHDDPPRRLPVGQPPQRLAPGPPALLPVRALVHPAAGHPDVLPRRSAVLPGSDLRRGPRAVPPRARSPAYDHDTTIAEWALGFRFDIVLRGPDRTPFEEPTR